MMKRTKFIVLVSLFLHGSPSLKWMKQNVLAQDALAQNRNRNASLLTNVLHYITSIFSVATVQNKLIPVKLLTYGMVSGFWHLRGTRRDIHG